MVIRTNNHKRPINYDHVPEWSEDPEASFTYKGDRYFLSEVLRFDMGIPEPTEPRADGVDHREKGPLEMAGYHGGIPFTVFSGLVVKVHPEEDAVTVAYFYE